MNCWGCPPELMEEFQPRFIHFLEHMEDPLKSEFLLPEMIGDLLHEGCAEVTVLPVHNKWYGVTYREDHEKVAAAMAALGQTMFDGERTARACEAVGLLVWPALLCSVSS